jgi:hypothetical protein
MARSDGHGDAVPLQRNFRVIALGCVAENAEGQPGDGGNHSDPANIARDAPDRSIVLQDSPLREQHAPIVFAAAKKRERLIAGVGHVGAYIRKVFEKPERRKGKSGGLTSKEEIRRAEERHEELPEGSAKNHYGFAEPTEKEVPALVNHQIDVIEEEKPATVQCRVQEKEHIEAEPADSCETGVRLPYTDAIFEKRHKPQRNKDEPAAKEFRTRKLPSARTYLMDSWSVRPAQPQGLKPLKWGHFSAWLKPCPDGIHL